VRRNGTPLGDQLIDGTSRPQGNDACHGSAAVRHLHTLTGDHPTDNRAGVLS
jgi:hypothetical protein